MIKLVYCFGRRPDLSPEQFAHYWQHVHGPIGARIPGLQRLVQSLAVQPPGEARKPDFDGMAELWFEDFAALAAARQSREWAASTADEAHFIDPSRVASFVSVERTVVDVW